MKIFDHPAQSQWAELCARTRKDDPQVAARVDAILERVRTEGDAALQALSLEIDRRPLAVLPGEEGLPLEVPASDIAAAAARVRPEVREAIATAAGHIRAFHEAQLPREIVVETAPGVRCIQRPVPIERVGLYIPGGTAPLFSTVLMLPRKCCTPPRTAVSGAFSAWEAPRLSGQWPTVRRPSPR